MSDPRVLRCAASLIEILRDFGYDDACADVVGGRVAIHNIRTPDLQTATRMLESRGECICQLDPPALDDDGELVFIPDSEVARAVHGTVE